VPDWRSQPIRGPLDGLAPSLLLPVEHDPLRDESAALQAALEAAGSPVRLELGPGLVHGCLRALETSPGTQRLVAAAAAAARDLLAGRGLTTPAPAARRPAG
jgi:acetyl esterase/lipase